MSSWIEKLDNKGKRGGSGVLVQISREVVSRKRSINGAISEVRHPAVLDALAERGDVGETWYVGDDPIRDVVGSLGSGFDRAVLYDPFTLYGLIDSGFRIDRLDRLPALVTGAGS